jgi:protein-L-isoaspartate O-methyltransferase
MRCSPEIPNILEGYRLREALSTFWLLLSKGLVAGFLTGFFTVSLMGCLSSCSKKPQTDATLFQKVTGDDPEDHQQSWNQLYSTQNYVFGKKAAAFLRAQTARIPVGQALDIAMGEGRNAVFLAKKGFQVTGVDLSEVAIRKAKLLAREQGVQIRTQVADLNQYQIPPERYDLIVNIQYLQRSLIPQMKAGLRKGGFILFENPTLQELERTPERNLRKDFLLAKGELRELFSDLEILEYSEGPGENGEVVARLVARKR